MFFAFKKFRIFLLTYEDENPKLLKRKYWEEILYKKYAKEPIFNGKNSLLELEKDFTELKTWELKDREVKIKREIEKNYFLNQLWCL